MNHSLSGGKSGLKRNTIRIKHLIKFKLGTYTLEKQKEREQTCSKEQKTQLYLHSHCISSTTLAASL